MTTENLIALWTDPPKIAENNFVYKSLCDWSYNVAVGCNHGCSFCYVPDVSTIKMAAKLKALYGVSDPDSQWGQYVFVRPFDNQAFLASMRRAENKSRDLLSRDGNRAVMLCTTTDPYQILFHPDTDCRQQVNKALEENVTVALAHLLDASSLNVRILTRSPLAKRDFQLMKKFGNRLLFVMSLPTLDNQLAKIYEPTAPAPSARLKCLQEAKTAGLNVFVAMAPTYPECGPLDLLHTLDEIAKLEPVTVFHEPINIRADNVKRIDTHAATLGMKMKTDVFATPQTWRLYAYNQMRQVEAAAAGLGIKDRLHLWPDKSLGSKDAIEQLSKIKTGSYRGWLEDCWLRVSEWPA